MNVFVLQEFVGPVESELIGVYADVELARDEANRRSGTRLRWTSNSLSEEVHDESVTEVGICMYVVDEMPVAGFEE